jgi:PAS domain-containing protein
MEGYYTVLKSSCPADQHAFPETCPLPVPRSGMKNSAPEEPAAPRGLWGSRLLYLGVALFAVLVALTGRSIYREWQEAVGQSRADAIFQLVQGKTPTRPTDAPGAVAWLNLELKRYRRLIADPGRARLYGEVADWQDSGSVPPFFVPLRLLLATPLAAVPPAPPERPVLLPPAEVPGGTGTGGDAGERAMVLRTQRYLELRRRWFVVTRRRALDSPTLADPPSPSNRFLARAAPHLLALADRLDGMLRREPLPELPGDRPPRVARLYALAEDGTLVSLPLPPPSADPAAGRRAALAEGREFRQLPELPTFVANEFYFRFDFAAPEGQCFYSGLYLDLGGQGLVATVAVPVADSATGLHWLVGTDITFDVDWETFARRIDPPMVAAAVQLAPGRGAGRPWAQLGGALRPGQDRTLAAAVAALATLAEREPRQAPSRSQPNVLHGVVAGKGAVAAFQVAATTWLLILFPKTHAHVPWLPVSLSAGMLVLLLAGFERNRRRAERAQEKAEGALREKQNLLNTMQVPLIVVDPNTDEVVSCNRAAEGLGIAPGSRIADMVAPDPRARAHYERMQVAGPAPRRAYGLPVRVRGDSGAVEERYAVVRSVAVTAPIEALHADERHRLGILFLLEPEADLALLTVELERATRDDERSRLTGLLSHGIDTLVRVLAYCLERGGGQDAEFAAWLAGYLDRRLRTTCWLLDHWDDEPPLPPDSAIEAAHARSTLERLESVFARVAADAELRSRLHWDNGVLSARPQAAGLFTVEIDWPGEFWFACPVRGGFGFFLGEALINAVQHGRPSSVPAVRIALDRVRRELLFEVENELRPEDRGRGERPGESYGGRRILTRLARLFDWPEPRFTRGESTFRVSWRVPASERGDPRKAD